MQVDIAPFRREDFYESRPELSTEATLPNTPYVSILNQYCSGPAFTIRIDGRIAACVGAYHPWQGLIDVWGIYTPVARQYPFPVVRATQRILKSTIRSLSIHRAQAEIRADFDTGHRFIKLLGFSAESVMEKYGPNGETFIRFVRLIP